MNRVGRLVAAAAICVGAACGDHPAGPVPGTLSVRLQNPNDGLDGAILFTLTGPTPPANPSAAAGDTLWGGPFTGPTNQFVLTGNIRTGVMLTFQVPDVNAASGYAVGVSQAAASSNDGLRDLTGYTVTVTK
jgi:hypothetical protein